MAELVGCPVVLSWGGSVGVVVVALALVVAARDAEGMNSGEEAVIVPVGRGKGRGKRKGKSRSKRRGREGVRLT